MNTKPRRKFKGRETVQKVLEKLEDYGRLSRSIGVIVEKNRPIFEGQNGKDERGPLQVDVVVCRGNSSGAYAKLSFTAEEAERLITILQESVPSAQDAERACREEREAWKKQRDVRYEPGPGRSVMSPGKTKRTREKQAKKRKAGGE